MAKIFTKRNLGTITKKTKRYLNVLNNSEDILDKLAETAEKAVLDAHSGVMGYDTVYVAEGVAQEEPQFSDIETNIVRATNYRSVEATGENFIFYEFGAGVKHNSPRKWRNDLNIPVPDEITPIGTYGQGHGSKERWYWDSGRQSTEGYPARQGFAIAINTVVAEVDKIVKEHENE